MAIPARIESILSNRIVESSRIDYKSDWNPEPIIHTITAFANDIDNQGGGYIVIGAEDEDGMPKFPIKGLERSSIDRIHKELVSKCNLIEPRYIPQIDDVSYEGKDLILIWVPGGNDRPYKCPGAFPNEKGRKTDKAYFIRKGSVTVKANQNEVRELFALADNIPFDDRPNPNATMDDIQDNLISSFLYSVDSKLQLQIKTLPFLEKIKAMHLVGGPEEDLRPLNVALMFFNEDPERFFPYARIDIVEKPDPTGIGMTERSFRGPLDQQLKDALRFMQNSVIAEKIFKLPDQAEALRFSSYPFPAIEEALSNAVYHKSYQIHEPITVMILPDRIEITSVPGPDRSISDDDLRNLRMVSRTNRNRRIGDYLKELKLAEGRNTGIPTLVRSMRENSSPDPVFLTDGDRSYFTVILPINEAFKGERPANANTGRRTIRKPNEVRSTVIRLLEENGEMSANELAVALGYPRVVNSLSLAIKSLIEEGKIDYTDKANRFSRMQKLHLAGR